MNELFVVDAVRTGSGRGKLGGALPGVHPVDLLATVLAAPVAGLAGLRPAFDDDSAGARFAWRSGGRARPATPLRSPTGRRLGHALGASGARLLTTLSNTLEADGARYGLQTMCEGGGMANATIIERV